MAEIETAVREAVGEIAREHGYKEYDVVIKGVDSGGANFTTDLFQITLTPKQQEPIKLFAKVAVGSEAMRKQMPVNLYEQERLFYEELCPKLTRIQDKNGVGHKDRLAVPKFYRYTNQKNKEVLILEDLGANGFVSFDRVRGISWEYAATAVEQLARFHALSFALHHENPEDYQTLLENYASILPHNDEYTILLRKLLKNNVLLVKEEFRERVKGFTESRDLVQKSVEFMKPTRLPILTHGDYKGSNLMHRIKDGRLEVVPMDYQTVFAGCPIYDLFYFIYTGSDEEFRRLHYHELVEHYYKELSNMLKRLHVDVDRVYPREAFEDDLSRLQLQGLTIALTFLSAIYMDSEDAPERGSEISETLFVPSKIYVEVLNGIVSDYVKWGIL